MLIEVAIGFLGIPGEFRSVFFILAMAAFATRIRWNGVTTVIACVGATVLIVLALFWTSVKSDFREIATASDDSQNIKASIDVATVISAIVWHRRARSTGTLPPTRFSVASPMSTSSDR